MLLSALSSKDLHCICEVEEPKPLDLCRDFAAIINPRLLYFCRDLAYCYLYADISCERLEISWLRQSYMSVEESRALGFGDSTS